MKAKRQFQNALSSAMKGLGFTKQSGAWYKHDDHVIVVIHPQKSNFDDTIYLDIGFYLRRLGSEKFPKGQQCHIRCRAEDFIQRADQLKLFDLNAPEWELPNTTAIFETFLAERLLRPVDKLSNLGELRQAFRGGLFKRCFVTAEVEAALFDENRT